MYAIDDKHEYQRPEESLEFVSEIFFDDPKRLGVLYSQFSENYIRLNSNIFDVFFQLFYNCIVVFSYSLKKVNSVKILLKLKII